METPKTRHPSHVLERLGLYRILPIHRLPLSLGQKILFVFLVVMVVSFLVTLKMSLDLIYKNLWRETEDTLKTDLKVSHMIVFNSIKDIDAVIDFTSSRFFLSKALEEGDLDMLGVQLERIRLDRGLDVLVLIDRDGVVLLRTTSPYAKGDNLSNEPLVRKALDGKHGSGLVILPRTELAREGDELALKARTVAKATSRSYPGGLKVVDSGMMMMAAYPVISSTGRLIGVLYGGGMVNNDHAIVDSIKSSMFPDAKREEANFAMVSVFFGDVRIATTLRLPNGNRATGFRMFSEAGESVLDNGRRWLGTAWVVNDWYFAAYEPLRDVDGKVVGSLGVGLWKGPFVAVRDNLIWGYIKISLMGLVITLLLGLLFSRMLTKPLRGLVEASGQLARGNLEYRIALRPGRDEIRDLEHAFNEMARKLHESMKEKDRLAQQLRDLNLRYIDLLGFASHELKQPTGVIKMDIVNLKSMKAGTPPDKMEAHLNRMERNVNYIISMSEKYLHYPKLDAGRITLSRSPCQILPEVIEPALEGEQKHILAKSMKVSIIGQKLLTKLTMRVDPEMMHVVFANLVSNAVRYGREGGAIQVGFKKSPEAYEFNVLNEGEGIPPEKLDFVFEKFARLEENGGSQRGTGLGLYNAREIVELHGGTIRVESETGKWANFVITFPRSRVEAEVKGGNEVAAAETADDT